MNKTPIKSITAGILGLVTTASLGIAQEAQAGTITADSQLQFSDVAVTLTNGTTTNLLTLFLEQTNASAFLNGVSDVDFDGPVPFPQSVTSNAVVIDLPSSAEGEGTVNNALNTTIAGTSANTQLLKGVGAENGRGVGGYEAFSDDFEADPGDTVNLTALFEPFLQVNVTGFTPGINEFKFAEAEYTAQFTINQIFADGSVGTIFQAPVLNTGISLQNQNGTRTFNAAPNFVNDSPFDELLDIDFVIPAGTTGTYEIRFSATSRVGGLTQQGNGIPEPSSLFGLAAIGFGALVSRQKRKQNTSN